MIVGLVWTAPKKLLISCDLLRMEPKRESLQSLFTTVVCRNTSQNEQHVQEVPNQHFPINSSSLSLSFVRLSVSFSSCEASCSLPLLVYQPLCWSICRLVLLSPCEFVILSCKVISLRLSYSVSAFGPVLPLWRFYKYNIGGTVMCGRHSGEVVTHSCLTARRLWDAFSPCICKNFFRI